MECSVCYTDLTVKNIVNTKCDHLFCKKCFWKWADQNNSCPMCRKNIISQTKMMMEEENIRNNIYSLMQEETKYYDTISCLQNDLYELEDKIFELSKFKKNPDKYMKEFMKKRETWINKQKEETRKKKDMVISQLDVYNALYTNSKEVLSQIKFEVNNYYDFDTELDTIFDRPLLGVGEINEISEILRTPSPRSEMQSPPPIIRSSRITQI